MKKKVNIFSIILFILSVSSVYSQKYNEEIYIYDTPTKILGKAYVNFIFIEDDLIKKIDYFEIKYCKKKITKIEHYSKNFNSKDFIKLESGDIEFNEKIAYKDVNFKNNKIFSDKFYNLLDSSFLKLTNIEKLKFINSLISKINK